MGWDYWTKYEKLKNGQRTKWTKLEKQAKLDNIEKLNKIG